MPSYGFVIDNRKCIGCHACSTACKSENSVPLGVNRTWVKYVEKGAYPNVQRNFQVTRCNHCANPPCVRICPVTAMYQRFDGIVEFDPDICIGCKACMQACPYDSIYIDPETNTAAKCHYCAHRTEIGLEPACVVVCPEHAIIAGDMDDPSSEISWTLATNQVTVRKPEQGTAPKLFYIEGNDWALHPTATERTPETFMFADVIPLHTIPVNHKNGSNGHHESYALSQTAVMTPALQNAPKHYARSGTPIRVPQTQGTPLNGPIQIGGKMAEHMVQVAYNAQHKIPWHWPVPAYLVTKGIGSGILMLLGLGLGLGLLTFDSPAFLASIFISLLFIGITTGFLVLDLEKPERFFSILLRPQWRSWLARGAFILVSLTAVAGIWWLIEAAIAIGWLPEPVGEAIRPVAAWLSVILAGGAATYTAFLFGQAEGRDLWQSSILPVHLLIQAFLVGSGAILMIDLFMEIPAALANLAGIVFVASVIIDLIATLFGEFGMPHGTEAAALAAHAISHGHYRRHFWLGSIVLGHLIPLALVLLGWPIALALAGLAAIAGLYFFEYAFVMAPQEVPNS